MYSVHHGDLKLLLETVRPASTLVIDPNPAALPAGVTVPECRIIHHIDNLLPQLQTLGRFDFGVVANTLEQLDRKTASAVVARLRDLHTRCFVALVPIGQHWEGHHSQWEPTDLLSYGMILMARYRADAKPLQLFHYAIESYKTTPDWFNSKHWAYPERWKP